MRVFLHDSQSSKRVVYVLKVQLLSPFSPCFVFHRKDSAQACFPKSAGRLRFESTGKCCRTELLCTVSMCINTKTCGKLACLGCLKVQGPGHGVWEAKALRSALVVFHCPSHSIHGTKVGLLWAVGRGIQKPFSFLLSFLPLY